MGSWKWLGELKQRDGGFTLSVGGEEDVRGAYCAMVLISLLNIPIDLPSSSTAKIRDEDTLVTRLPEYLSRCQTFEGGISGSPGAEAHGAYAFCALACLCILGEPSDVLPRHADSYHSCYVLAGLSSAQHYYYFSPKSRFDSCFALSSAFHWEASEVIPKPDGKAEDTVFDEEDRVRLIHPVYVLPWGLAETTRAWFNGLDPSLG
ncbi:hypothetical protein FGG08_005941 [Glutinoglossum americanum]|uniref:Prenyltransferase alpha-alpha toroid domain-containing protein n=1 Tax=Glutinoglossum americanum TaxID=1670608 RepID=A0A9P8L0X2_9PEZI|nr:hypothetical protein FGG08_005941 [Glutinoglossum americanum]